MPDQVVLEAKALAHAPPWNDVLLTRAGAQQFVTVQVGEETALVDKDALLIAAKAVCEEDER